VAAQQPVVVPMVQVLERFAVRRTAVLSHRAERPAVGLWQKTLRTGVFR